MKQEQGSSKIKTTDPEILGVLRDIHPAYGMYVLYLPIKMIGTELRIPMSLMHLSPLIYQAIGNFDEQQNLQEKYIYLSYECSYVRKGTPQKRPGLHCDGFLTDDVNFIWTDKDPTLFYAQKFELTPDHMISIQEMESTVDRSKAYWFPECSLVRIDSTVPHEVAAPAEDGVRQFFKLSVSSHKYNLKGNTHNPLFKYDWKMYDREEVRNHPIYAEADSVPEGGVAA
ncbi:MAG: hypothetical protein J7501_03925 [Bdellovibrio sp.]|nr:hypothetical protein [Bdellovibrio sp.]